MEMKRFAAAAVVCAMMITVTGCQAGADASSPAREIILEETAVSGTAAAGSDFANLTGDYSDRALDASWDEDEATKIQMSGSGITISGDGAFEDGGVVTVTKGGTYAVSGNIDEGQLVVDLDKAENVQLVFNGALIANSSEAPIVVKNAKNVFLTLAAGTQNSVLDKREKVQETAGEEKGETAAIYSKADFIINGSGALIVEGGYNDGITSRDDLEIIDGTLDIRAADDGIVGKDSISIRSGNLRIEAKGDGMKTSNSEEDKGRLIIDGGTIEISAVKDGIHSEKALVINGGNVTISESNEGLESLNIVINGGEIEICSEDDGINISDGIGSAGGGSKDPKADGSPEGARMHRAGSRQPAYEEEGKPDRQAGKLPPGGGGEPAVDGTLVINGGNVRVNAKGDGLDSNGNIQMTGGMVTISGPEDARNSAVDYNGTFEITGGVLLTAEYSQRWMTPLDHSSQGSVSILFSERKAGGTAVSLLTETGELLCTFTPEKMFQSVRISAPEITAGSAYIIEAGGEKTEVTAE